MRLIISAWMQREQKPFIFHNHYTVVNWKYVFGGFHTLSFVDVLTISAWGSTLDVRI